MATFKDINKTSGEDFARKIPTYEYKGKVRSIHFEYDLDGALSSGDVILGLDLPQNCKIVDAYISSPSMSTTGIFDLGTAADPNGLVVGADAGGQAVLERAGADAALLGTVNESATPIQLTVTEDTVATSGKIRACVLVSIE